MLTQYMKQICNFVTVTIRRRSEDSLTYSQSSRMRMKCQQAIRISEITYRRTDEPIQNIIFA